MCGVAAILLWGGCGGSDADDTSAADRAACLDQCDQDLTSCHGACASNAEQTCQYDCPAAQDDCQTQCNEFTYGSAERATCYGGCADLASGCFDSCPGQSGCLDTCVSGAQDCVSGTCGEFEYGSAEAASCEADCYTTAGSCASSCPADTTCDASCDDSHSSCTDACPPAP